MTSGKEPDPSPYQTFSDNSVTKIPLGDFMNAIRILSLSNFAQKPAAL